MSQRFYFDLENNDEILRDKMGVDADDPGEVLDEARDVIAELADDLMDVGPDASWKLIVRDDAGVVVGRLPICGQR